MCLPGKKNRWCNSTIGQSRCQQQLTASQLFTNTQHCKIMNNHFHSKEMAAECVRSRTVSLGRLHFRFLLAMKLTIFLIIVFSLRVSAGAYAQRVSLSLKDATLEKAFEEIRKQSPYDFVYHDKFIRLAHPITLDVKDIDIDEALQKLFAGQPFRYEVVNHIVTIQPRTSFPADSENLILAYTEVRGRVVDSLD